VATPNGLKSLGGLGTPGGIDIYTPHLPHNNLISPNSVLAIHLLAQ